jgi:hypothetical protein
VLLLFALTVPELGFALFYEATDSYGQCNVYQKWSARHVVANGAGFRDDLEFPTSREPGRLYLGFLGDRFTIGHGVRRVADRFSDRIARELETASPGRVRVFNTGLPGMSIVGLADALVPAFIRDGIPMDVLVYVFVPNDIEKFDERTTQYCQAQQASEPRFFLWRETYFYNWLYVRVRGMLSANQGDYYGYLAEAYTGEPWRPFTAKLDHLQDQCAAGGIELRVVIFPFLNGLGEGDPFAPAYDRLLAHCQQTKLPCLDLRPALLPHVGEGLMVSRFDAHPNERAHQIAAEAIFTDLPARLKGDGVPKREVP